MENIFFRFAILRDMANSVISMIYFGHILDYLFNQFMLSGPVHVNPLDRSICNKRTYYRRVFLLDVPVLNANILGPD